MAAPIVSFWEDAETQCKHGNFQAAAAVLIKCVTGILPVTAAGAVLAVSRHSNVGFNKYDHDGHALASLIEKGERLDAWQTKRCRALAVRYATQAMTKVWGEGGPAGAQRLQRLLEGRDPWSGDELCWGDDGGGGDEAVEVGGAAAGDSSEEDEAEDEDEDGDMEGFIAPDKSEDEDEAESSESSEEEEEEPPARRTKARRDDTRDKKRARTAARKLEYEEEEEEEDEGDDREWTPPRRSATKRRSR